MLLLRFIRRTKKCCLKYLKKITTHTEFTWPTKTDNARRNRRTSKKYQNKRTRHQVASTPEKSGIIQKWNNNGNPSTTSIKQKSHLNDVHVKLNQAIVNMHSSNNFQIQKHNQVIRNALHDSKDSTKLNHDYLKNKTIFKEHQLTESEQKAFLKKHNSQKISQILNLDSNLNTHLLDSKIEQIEADHKCTGPLESLTELDEGTLKKAEYDKNNKRDLCYYPYKWSISSNITLISFPKNQCINNYFRGFKYSSDTYKNMIQSSSLKYDEEDTCKQEKTAQNSFFFNKKMSFFENSCSFDTVEQSEHCDKGNICVCENNCSNSLTSFDLSQSVYSICNLKPVDTHSFRLLESKCRNSYRNYNVSRSLNKINEIRSHKKDKFEIHSKRKMSFSNVETWIDDELFDNSFNEELEKRCSILDR